ncbi:MAG: acyltransferase [Leptospirillia bacterium]
MLNAFFTRLARALAPRMHRAFAELDARVERVRVARIREQLGRCGEGVHLNGRVTIAFPELAELGDNVHVGDGSQLMAKGGIRIGDHTHISRNVVIYSANHNIEGERLPYDDTYLEKPVVIGRNVWVGANVCITPGVTIGDGAVVGMGCVVSRDVPEMTIVGNEPFRVLGRRDEAHYRKLDAAGKYGGVNGRSLDG